MKSKPKRQSLVQGQNKDLNGNGSDWALFHANKHVIIGKRIFNFLFEMLLRSIRHQHKIKLLVKKT